MQFNSTKSSNPVVSTSICTFRWFAFFTVVFLLDATLSVQAFQVTDTQFKNLYGGIFEAREVGAITNTLVVKASFQPHTTRNKELSKRFIKESLKIEHAILREIEQKTAAVPEHNRHLVLLACNYVDLQHNLSLPNGEIAELAIVFPLFKEGKLCNLLKKATEDPWSYPITKASVLSISRSILNGLKLLHQTVGFVHGNIKTSSIFLERRSMNEMSASIADFSRASPIDEVRVTLGYAPPEQFNAPRHVSKTAAFDVFSFGSVLYQLALGKHFDADILKYVQNNFLTPGLPKTLRSIVIRCWSQVPHERPTIDEILEALDVYALDNGFDSSSNL